VAPLNADLWESPMRFNLTDEKSLILSWRQHLVGLLPVIVRETGTGHPSFSIFT
jgi:hypothetical protein